MDKSIKVMNRLISIAQFGISILEDPNLKTYGRKSDGSILAKADTKLNEILIEKISNEFPGIPILSEEGKHEELLKKGDIIVLDPLDGTTNYVNNIPLSTISIALVKNNKPICGVVASCSGEAYFSYIHKGSFFSKSINNIDNAQKIKCGSRPINKSILNVTCNQNNSKSRIEWWNWLSILKPPTCYRLRIIESAALEMCWLAHGKIDGYLHPSDKPWDVAAGSLIAQEAGALLFNTDFTVWNLEKDGIIAITPKIESQLRRIIGKLH